MKYDWEKTAAKFFTCLVPVVVGEILPLVSAISRGDSYAIGTGCLAVYVSVVNWWKHKDDVAIPPPAPGVFTKHE